MIIHSEWRVTADERVNRPLRDLSNLYNKDHDERRRWKRGKGKMRMILRKEKRRGRMGRVEGGSDGGTGRTVSSSFSVDTDFIFLPCESQILILLGI